MATPRKTLPSSKARIAGLLKETSTIDSQWYIFKEGASKQGTLLQNTLIFARKKARWGEPHLAL
jgi:hypothetical protein